MINLPGHAGIEGESALMSRAARVNTLVETFRLNSTYSPDEFEKSGVGFRVVNDGIVTAFCHSGSAIRFLAYLEFAAGQVRGNHYRLKKIEYLYVLRGSLNARYSVVDDLSQTVDFVLHEGDGVRVEPGCLHSYTADGPVVAVEFSPQPFDGADTYRLPSDSTGR